MLYLLHHIKGSDSMNLFDFVRPKFFNPLSSSGNQRLNADCLLTIYHVYDQEISYKLDRASIRDAVAAYLMDQPMEDEGTVYESPNDYANAVLRRFLEAGWLEEETDDVTYERQIQMTEHGIALAEFISQITHPKKEEYTSYVFRIYNTLKNESQWRSDPYVYALKEVHSNAKQLANALKKLSTMMKSIIEELVQEETLESLTEHLMAYCDGTFIKEYARLTKQQNIHLYRSEIRQILEEMKQDRELYDLIVTGCFVEEEMEQESDAEEKVYAMFQSTIQFLTDDYDRIMNGIKKKINIYFNLAVGRARFLMNHDVNTRGCVEQTLRYLIGALAAEDKKADLPDEMQPLFNLYIQEFLACDSLRFPVSRRTMNKPSQQRVPVLTEDDVNQAAARQRKAAFDPYSKAAMKRYTEHMMGTKTELCASEFPLEGKGDVLAVTAAAAYAKENGYTIEISDDYLETDGFILRDFTLHKKMQGKGNV